MREGSTGEVLAVLKGHEDSVSDLKFSPDGKRLATASYDNSVKLWAMPPKAMEAGQKRALAIEPLLTLNGHDNWVMCLAFSPDGTRLASGSYDKTIRIWDVRGGQELQKREGHTAAVRSLVFLSKDRFASAGSDRSIKLWDLNSSQELATLKQHTGAVRALSYSPQSQRLASASEDKTIKLWDLSQFKPESAEQPLPEPQTLQGHAGMIWSLAFSRSGSVLASGDLTGQIKMWDPATGKERMTLKGHTDIVSTLAFDRNGRFLISGSYDKRLLLWKGNVPLPTLTELATIAKPENRVRIAVVSPDGRWLALSGGTQSTELRDLHDLKADPVLLNQRKSSSHLAFSPDSRLIAIGTYSGEIKLWNLHEKKWLSDLVRHDGQVQRVAFAPNGKRLASVGWDHVLKLWDLTEHKLLATSAIEPLLMSDVAFSPDGKTLATCSGNWKEWRTPGEVKLWSVEPLKELKVLGGHEQEIRGVAFTPKGDRLVSYSSSSTGTTKVWDLTTGQELGRFAGCAALTLLPSGRHAVTGDLYGKMRLFDLVTFQPLLSFTGHKDLIYTLSPSPDGSLVASVCRDGAVTLWPTSPNLEQGEPQ